MPPRSGGLARAAAQVVAHSTGSGRHRGWVRSFRHTWGFLRSDEFQGDLFVGLKGNPHLSCLAQDDQVEFEVKEVEHGRPEAVNVEVLRSGPQSGKTGISGGPGTRPGAGRRHAGRVRSFRDAWGFINSSSFPGDLFVGLKGNPHLDGLSKDDPVEFEIRHDKSGKAEAVNVRLIRDLAGTESGPGGHRRQQRS